MNLTPSSLSWWLAPLSKYADFKLASSYADSSFGPASWLELNHELALKTPSLLEHSTISAIAEKHGKTTAQVLLRWATQRGVAVIPKSSNLARAKENLDSIFDLEEKDLEAISALNENRRLADPVAIHPALAIYA